MKFTFFASELLAITLVDASFFNLQGAAQP